MGKKGSWFSAIKKAFSPNSKDKESDKRSGKEKKWKGLGKLRNGETKSFIPLFREPSSIEKILGEAEREHKEIFRPSTPQHQPSTPPYVPPRAASPRVPSQRNSPPRVSSPKASSLRAVSPPRRARSPPPRPPPPIEASPPPRPPSPRAASPLPRPSSPRAPSPLPRPSSPRAPSPPPQPPQRAASPRIIHPRPEPTLRDQHASATKIQTAYRGYMARRSFRAVKGLVRLQEVVGGQNAKRQTTNAMKYMQLMVRVQSQIQSRRIQTLENQARLQANKQAESTLSKCGSEAGNGNWDDSVLTKEEREARLHRKVEAVVKRERAMAYSYSNQLWKTNQKSAQSGLSDTRTGAFPWWWNWLERQLPSANTSESQGAKSFQLTPPRLTSSNKQYHFGYDPAEASTPKSTRSTVFPASRQARTPPSYGSTSGLPKYSKPRARGGDSPFNLPLKDDDSLISCPPFSVPNYMTPTASAKAKVRASSNPRERFPGSPSASEVSRRSSFPLTQGIGSFKHQSSAQSVSNMSVNSTVSMPGGRKPFNRFV